MAYNAVVPDRALRIALGLARSGASPLSMRSFSAAPLWIMAQGGRTMSSSANPIANPLVVLRQEFDDWAILFDPDTAEATCINPVGVAVWQQLDGQHSVEEIIAALRRDYDDVSDTVEQEVTAFVQQLVERGFAGYEVQGSNG
jgi:SynChlorMet cassette protein ScmD